MDEQDDELRELEAEVAADPGNLDALFALAQVYLEEGRWEEAVGVYEQAMGREPENAALANDLAVLYDDAGEAEAAERYYRRALALDRTHGPTYVNLGTLLAVQGREEEAEAMLAAGMEHAADEEDRQEAENQLIELRGGEDLEEADWVPVSVAAGITVAELLAGRLRAAGIPAHAVQEGAGQALGLTVGPLGNGIVLVPAERAQEARQVLAEGDLREPGEVGVYSPDEIEDELNPLARGALAATAFIVSPLGSAAAALLSGFFEEEDDELLLLCPHCDAALELSDEEWELDSVVCPACEGVIDLTELED